MNLRIVLLALMIGMGGCAEMEKQAQATRPAQTNAPDATASKDQKKVKQWFTTDTPETLPADKLEKMNLGGAGFGGAY
jgi:uncharacterized protein YceK